MIPFDHILDNRLNTLSNYIDRMAEAMSDEFMKTMFDVFNATTEKTAMLFSQAVKPHMILLKYYLKFR